MNAPTASDETHATAHNGAGENAERSNKAARFIPRPRVRAATGLLAIVLMVALGLRVYGIDWDDGGLFHPDERAILTRVVALDLPSADRLGDLLDADASPLNPGWFNYGSFPMYALKAVQIGVSPFVDLDVFSLRLPGRAMSAVVDVGTVLLVYLFGARWYDRRVGLLGAALAALSVIHIQLSHFFAVDTILAFFIASAVFFLTRVAHRGTWRDSVFAGAMFGLALATKASAAPLALAFVAAHAIAAFSARGSALSVQPLTERRVRRFVLGGVVSAAAAFVVLMVAQPYTLLDYQTFFGNVGEQSEMVRRIADLPYTRQYVDTTPYLYQARQLATWGLGPVLGAAAWVGLAAAAVWAWRSGRKSDLVILAWVLPYLAINGWFDVKFMRYMLPVTPFLMLYAARLAWALIDMLQRWGKLRRLAAPAVLGLLLIPTAHYALAFVSMYSHPHPAQAASEWVNGEAPARRTLLKEHWEEGLPDIGRFDVQELPLYNPDHRNKISEISDLLAEGDYLVLFSNRLYGTIPRLPDRYPLSTAYYERLFAGDLGYELQFTGHRPMSFLGIGYSHDPMARVDLSRPDGFEQSGGALFDVGFGWADESFTVYDHPRTMVFYNTGRLESSELLARVVEDTRDPGADREPGLMLTDEEAEKQQANGTWSDIVVFGHDSSAVSWIVWLAAIEVMGLLALPLGMVLFRPLANPGYLLHKPLGLLLVAFGAWIMAATGVMEFSRASVFAALGALGVVGLALGYGSRAGIRQYLREHWKQVLSMEALFLVAFAAFLFVRLANPDLWHPWRGGEKPMDFAYLNAVLKSTVMPPYDPWFAGGYLNYYYFGQFIVASVIKLTGIVPAIAYNLAVPTLFAMTVGGAFTIVHGLVARTRRGARGKSAAVAGLGAVVLVAIIGNLDAFAQLLSGASRAVFNDEPFGTFDFWRSSRLFPELSPGSEITEFPYFTFLFGDLHAHLIAIPFALLGVGLSISIFLRAASTPRGRLSVTLASLAALALTIGALRTTNAWDFPTALGIAAIAVFAGETLSREGALKIRALRAMVKFGLVAILSHVLFLPYHNRYELFNDGLLLSEFQTPLWVYLSVYSIFLFSLAAYFLAVGWPWVKRTLSALFPDQSTAETAERQRDLLIGGALIVIGASAVVAGIVTTGYVTLALGGILAILLAAAWMAALRLRVHDRMELGIATALGVCAIGISLLPDVFTVKDDIGRMNTVFKFYLQAWVLFGLSSAFLLWRTWASLDWSPKSWGLRRTVAVTAFAGLLAAVLIYPVMGTPARLEQRFDTSFVTLDGSAYMEEAVYHLDGASLDLSHDRRAIRWMQENIEGSPVIIEGLTDLYRWGNRVSIYTGLPAVVGWDWHQRQQRVEYASAVTERRRDVQRFYSSPSASPAEEVLREYGVQYVYVGELERSQYPEAGIGKLRRMAEDGLLDAVYDNEPVTIYRVNEEELAARADEAPGGGAL